MGVTGEKLKNQSIQNWHQFYKKVPETSKTSYVKSYKSGNKIPCFSMGVRAIGDSEKTQKQHFLKHTFDIVNINIFQ